MLATFLTTSLSFCKYTSLVTGLTILSIIYGLITSPSLVRLLRACSICTAVTVIPCPYEALAISELYLILSRLPFISLASIVPVLLPNPREV